MDCKYSLFTGGVFRGILKFDNQFFFFRLSILLLFIMQFVRLISSAV